MHSSRSSWCAGESLSTQKETSFGHFHHSVCPTAHCVISTAGTALLFFFSLTNSLDSYVKLLNTDSYAQVHLHRYLQQHMFNSAM